jgi:ABC-type spermidine/putrescine transport system permease subunit II
MRALRVLGIGLIVVFILAPTLIVIAVSFGDSAVVQFPPHGLSLR